MSRKVDPLRGRRLEGGRGRHIRIDPEQARGPARRGEQASATRDQKRAPRRPHGHDERRASSVSAAVPTPLISTQGNSTNQPKKGTRNVGARTSPPRRTGRQVLATPSSATSVSPSRMRNARPAEPKKANRSGDSKSTLIAFPGRG